MLLLLLLLLLGMVMMVVLLVLVLVKKVVGRMPCWYYAGLRMLQWRSLHGRMRRRWR